MARMIEPLRRMTKGPMGVEPAFPKPRTRTFTLPEQIAESVAEAIINGTYPPGSWIAEQELADLFHVSRGPIRDALRILEREGLIQILPRRGTMVTQLTRQEVLNIFSIRAALMGLAGRQTAEQLTENVEEELLESVSKLDRLVRERDVNDFLRSAYRFSMLLARTSNNNRLFELILSMARQTLPLTRMALDNRDNRREWTKNWRMIVQAILSKDPAAAEKAAHRLVTQIGNQAAQHAIVDPAPGKRNGKLNGRHSQRTGSKVKT